MTTKDQGIATASRAKSALEAGDTATAVQLFYEAIQLLRTTLRIDGQDKAVSALLGSCCAHVERLGYPIPSSVPIYSVPHAKDPFPKPPTSREQPKPQIFDPFPPAPVIPSQTVTNSSVAHKDPFPSLHTETASNHGVKPNVSPSNPPAQLARTQKADPVSIFQTSSAPFPQLPTSVKTTVDVPPATQPMKDRVLLHDALQVTIADGRAMLKEALPLYEQAIKLFNECITCSTSEQDKALIRTETEKYVQRMVILKKALQPVTSDLFPTPPSTFHPQPQPQVLQINQQPLANFSQFPPNHSTLEQQLPGTQKSHSHSHHSHHHAPLPSNPNPAQRSHSKPHAEKPDQLPNLRSSAPASMDSTPTLSDSSSPLPDFNDACGTLNNSFLTPPTTEAEELQFATDLSHLDVSDQIRESERILAALGAQLDANFEADDDLTAELAEMEEQIRDTVKPPK